LTFFALDRLLLIPASTPPHKNAKAISHAHHRYTMTVLAVEDEPKLQASLFEIERPDLPYSVQTVTRLREQYGIAATDLFFLIGADSFAELHTWREPMKLIEGCNLVVTTRPGYNLDLDMIQTEWRQRIVDLRNESKADAESPDETKIYLTDLTWVDVSATRIRDAARAGRSISDWVPPRVADYIEKYGLYRAVND
jgi:nicotinate-nucleotide adenylyltransferase